MRALGPLILVLVAIATYYAWQYYAERRQSRTLEREKAVMKSAIDASDNPFLHCSPEKRQEMADWYADQVKQHLNEQFIKGESPSLPNFNQLFNSSTLTEKDFK